MLALRGLEYESREVDVIDRSGRAELLGELNPSLTVPVLILDDGRPLGESNAILCYLARGTQYLPDEPFDEAKVLQWLFFEQYSHEPNIAVARFLLTYSDRPAPMDYVARLQKLGDRALAAMDAPPRDQPTSSRRAVHDRRHRAFRLHPRRARGRLRSPRYPTRRGVARRGCAAQDGRLRHALTGGVRRWDWSSPRWGATRCCGAASRRTPSTSARTSPPRSTRRRARREARLVVTHGNGPQVGLLALQADAYAGASRRPLDVLGAESEGMIGYLLEQGCTGSRAARRRRC